MHMQSDSSLTREEKVLQNLLIRAVDEFGMSMVPPRVMRIVAMEFPNSFFNVAPAIIKAAPDGPGKRFLTLQLVNCGEFLARLTNPDLFSRNEVMGLCRQVMQVDHLLDVKIAQRLPGRSGGTGQLTTSGVPRALDILDEISEGNRVVPMLTHLTEHPEPHVAAKATLVVGRRVRNLNWLQRHMKKPDPRIRANVLESMWGVQAIWTKPVFQEHLKDGNNRVWGNALMGLYFLGEPSAVDRFLRMGVDQRPNFRWTTAWALGQIGKPELVDTLHSMIRDDSPVVRKAALQSLARIRRVMKNPNGVEPAKPAPPEPESRPAPRLDTLVEAVAEAAPKPPREDEPPIDELGLLLRLDGRAFSARQKG
jgi:hypothetical protein